MRRFTGTRPKQGLKARRGKQLTVADAENKGCVARNELFDFNALLDKHLYRESKPKQVGRYYPSEVGACLRKTWFSFKFPIEFDAEKRRLFETGNILHDYIVHVFKSEKTPEVELLKSEMPCSINCGDFVISGRVDDVLLLKVSGKTVLVEVKSAARLPRSPSKHHAAQLQFYLHATGMREGALLYVEKNTLNSVVFSVSYDERVASEGIARFAALHKALLEDKAPEPEAKLRQDMRWWCDYCEYVERCAATRTGEASGVKCGLPETTARPFNQSHAGPKEKTVEEKVEQKTEPDEQKPWLAASAKPKQTKLV
ncbi:MAG: PD-(D/E)XK nuclease family protein [Candidatus Norongarragalinales archaeon]